MCVVSFIGDFYRQTVPNSYPQPLRPQPFQWPDAAPATLPWNKEALDMLKELIERTKKLDEKLGLPDCEDERKHAWMADIERRVKALEDKKGGK